MNKQLLQSKSMGGFQYACYLTEFFPSQPSSLRPFILMMALITNIDLTLIDTFADVSVYLASFKVELGCGFRQP